MAFSFRCGHCGHLEPGAHAGQNAVPHACCACGSGVVFAMDIPGALAHPRVAKHKAALEAIHPDELTKPFHTGGRVIPLPFGIKFLHHENWEKLWEASDERLTELGLTRADVVEHVPGTAAPNLNPQLIAVTGGNDNAAKLQDVVGGAGS